MVETWESPEFILSYMAKAKLQKLPVFLLRCHVKTKNVNKRVKTETLDTIIPHSAVALLLTSQSTLNNWLRSLDLLTTTFIVRKTVPRTFWSIGKSQKKYCNIIPLCTSSHLIIIICMCIYLLWVLVSSVEVHCCLWIIEVIWKLIICSLKH